MKNKGNFNCKKFKIDNFKNIHVILSVKIGLKIELYLNYIFHIYAYFRIKMCKTFLYKRFFNIELVYRERISKN